MKSELAARLEKIEDERRSVLEKARAQAEDEAENLRLEMEQVRRELTRARQPLEALKPVQQRVEEIAETVQQVVARQQVIESSSEQRALRPGDKVRVRSIKMDGVISAVGESDVEVQVGNLRVRARLSDLLRQGEVEPPTKLEGGKGAPAGGRTTYTSASPFRPSPGMEIDLRGQRVEDALDALDRYIESAYLAGLPFVRIIHGKGTGRLREVMRVALSGSPHVKRWESGGDKEGGDGVTVAHLAVEA
jgi:DNA mismatch repair protein MutS2